MSYLYFIVAENNQLQLETQEISEDEVLIEHSSEPVYRIDTDVNQMSKDELQLYLSAYHQNPKDLVPMSGISRIQ